MTYKKDVADSQKELKINIKNNMELITKAKYGPSKLTRIPLYSNEELAFFVGAIIGDGHLRISKFQTTIECANKKLLRYLQYICKNIFKREFNIYPVKLRAGRKQTFCMVMDSKAIYNLLNKVFEIPSGKKSHIVKVPNHIINSKKHIKISFLKGILATEGGKRRRGFGLSTASKELWLGLLDLFSEVGIPTLKDKWIYKKYNKEYYGIVFKSKYMNNLMWECRSGQTE